MLRLESVVVEYKQRGFLRHRQTVRAVNGVSFSMAQGSTLGIVGESGGGKSTLLKAICRFVPIKSGRIFIDDVAVSSLSPKAFFPYRKKIQMIPQDFYDIFNPKMSVEEILREPLEIHFRNLTEKEKNMQIGTLLTSVELDYSLRQRLPAELSGGQRQRLSIARGLAVNPELLICDEIISACDLFSQKQILSLLTRLNKKKKIAMLFISHNIAAVANFCREIIVMYHGEFVEYGTAEEICTAPRHPYTQLLIDVVSHAAEQKACIAL